MMDDLTGLPLFAAATDRERVQRGKRRRLKGKAQEICDPKVVWLEVSDRPTLGAGDAGGEIVYLPITRRRDVIMKLARRLSAYGGKQGRFFIRAELEKAAARRISKGIPASVAMDDVDTLERAIHVAAAVMFRPGDAA
jgi:hypothetical protein